MRWKAFFLAVIGFLFLIGMGLLAAGCTKMIQAQDFVQHGVQDLHRINELTTYGIGKQEVSRLSTLHSEYKAIQKPEADDLDEIACMVEKGISRPYKQNANFKVVADTLWLYRLPLTDSLPVVRNDELVVAEFALQPADSTKSVWVKVARDQETIGWLPEQKLLQGIVPVDPISQGIHWFSSSHTVPFLVISAGFALWFAIRAVRRKQIRLIGLNDIDSIFPLSLSWLLAVAATLYNSILHFNPLMWEVYYYNPSLNPFQLPFMIGLFIFCIWLIILMGIAMLDDLFHQTSVEIALFYLTGLAACCIFLYIFLTCLPVGIAYVCLAAYSFWVFKRLKKASHYPYACGACGAKMRAKGICPHCGAMNE